MRTPPNPSFRRKSALKRIKAVTTISFLAVLKLQRNPTHPQGPPKPLPPIYQEGPPHTFRPKGIKDAPETPETPISEAQGEGKRSLTGGIRNPKGWKPKLTGSVDPFRPLRSLRPPPG